MTVLLDIFGFLSVLLRGLQMAFEALTVGGVIFLTGIAAHGEGRGPAQAPDTMAHLGSAGVSGNADLRRHRELGDPRRVH